MKIFLIVAIIGLLGCSESSPYPAGGYDYPKQVDPKDTNYYYYPTRDLETTRDSFNSSYLYVIYRRFHEPNLSIRQQVKETFRISFFPARGETILISLTPYSITVKKGILDAFFTMDDAPLTELEKYHLSALQRRFPIDTMDKSHPYSRSLDSLVRLYPQLLDLAYYKKLLDKTIIPDTGEFKFYEAKINVSKIRYDSLIQEINAAGFWNLPYYTESESYEADGYSFVIEANTTYKYKVVIKNGYPGDTTKLTKACQRIINFAKMGDELNLIHDGTIDSLSVEK